MAHLYDSTVIEAKVTAPTAGQTLATLGVLPTGKYRLRMIHYNTGTLAEIDDSNVILKFGAVAKETLTTGHEFAESDYMSDGTSITLAAVAAGTAGSIYHVKITATLLGNRDEY